MKAKVVYIVSVGHSGSTLLDILTGSLSSTFSTGELTYLPWQIFRHGIKNKGASPQMLCSCGEGFYDCPEWRKIIKEISETKGFDVYDDPFRFKINLLHEPRYVSGKFSTKRIQRLIFSILSRSRLLIPFTKIWELLLKASIENNWCLFDIIARINNVEYIIDSSKSIQRLKLLHSYRPENVRVLVLMRDIRGVAFSAQKQKQDPLIAAKGWVVQYQRIFSTLSNMKNVRAMFVQYEEMARQPSLLRQKIAEFLELPEPSDTLDINTKDMHLVAGNIMRTSGQLSIRLDESWREMFSTDMQNEIEKIRSELIIPEHSIDGILTFSDN